MVRKVLLITYYFPPRPGVASLRLRGLAKYLPEFGWEPIILTAALPGEPDPRFKVVQTPYPGDVSHRFKRRLHLQPNKGFQEQVGVPLAIRGAKRSLTSKAITFIKGIIAYPDEQKAWLPFAVDAGHELLRKEKFDAVLSSSGPATCHLIAKELKRKHKVPWVADLRDLWTQNHYYAYNNVRKWFERRLEIKTLNEADALVTVSEPLAKDLGSLHHKTPVFAIPNGFDPDEMGTAPLTKEFTITYTGQLYQGKRDPELLLKALHELIKDGIVNPGEAKVRFFGPIEYWLDQEIEEYHLEEMVKQYGMVPREIALTKQRESQILLLLNWDDLRESGVYTGKLFEYLAAKRPILAIGGPKGVVSKLLDETGAGVHVSALDHLKQTLVHAYREYNSSGEVRYTGNEAQIQRYSHREMASRFADVLEEATQTSSC